MKLQVRKLSHHLISFAGLLFLVFKKTTEQFENLQLYDGQEKTQGKFCRITLVST